MNKNVKIIENKMFTIEKQGKKVRWKIVRHPHFSADYSLVRDHIYLKSGICTKDDMKHIGYGGKTLEEAYQAAFLQS